MSDCWPNYENCEVHRPGRTPAADVFGSIRCMDTADCLLMHGHRGPCAPVPSPESETT